MKKLLFIAVCCLMLCGCEKEKITICKNDANVNDEHLITIKHFNNKIVYYKNEYKTTYNTISEAISEEKQWQQELICDNGLCYSSTEGEKGWNYTVVRDNKTIYLTQETNDYDINYDEELKYIESLQNYICSEQ